MTLSINTVRVRPSQRELQCLLGVASGQTTIKIAKELGISKRTVDHHIANTMLKLAAPTRSAAVALAVTRGLIQIEDCA